MTDEEPFFVYGNKGRRGTYLILAVPHAGRYYPKKFLAETRLKERELRLSEDAYADELFWNEKLKVPMIRDNYARNYIDVNREPLELNQKLFKDELPTYVNHFSIRAAKGFGTIPQVVKREIKIYNQKLYFNEVKERIATVYQPYHNTLAQMIKDNVAKFGSSFILDCHTMPTKKIERSADIVIGDNYGTAADKNLVCTVMELLEDAGFKVVLNRPYAGGYTTCHYGCPELGVQALQIEVRRSLYMNETTFEKLPYFNEISCKLRKLVQSLKIMMS